MSPELALKKLLNQKIVSIEGCRTGSGDIVFDLEDGRRFLMTHHQDCCESVSVDKISGSVDSVLNSKVVLAHEHLPGYAAPECHDSYTWSEYIIETENGGRLVILWLGESNGYYSEGVDFEEVKQ